MGSGSYVPKTDAEIEAMSPDELDAYEESVYDDIERQLDVIDAGSERLIPQDEVMARADAFIAEYAARRVVAAG